MQETWVWSLGQENSPGEGNGNPLQYSCLENPMDRGAWWAIVHRVTKSQMWLKWLSTQHTQGVDTIEYSWSPTLVPPSLHHIMCFRENQRNKPFWQEGRPFAFSFTPIFLSQLLQNTSLNKNLTSSCHGDDQCVFDVLATRSEKLGKDTRAVFRIYQQMNTTRSKWCEAWGGVCRVRAQIRGRPSMTLLWATRL